MPLIHILFSCFMQTFLSFYQIRSSIRWMECLYKGSQPMERKIVISIENSILFYTTELHGIGNLKVSFWLLARYKDAHYVFIVMDQCSLTL